MRKQSIPDWFIKQLQDRPIYRLRRYKGTNGREVVVPQEYILGRKRMFFEAIPVEKSLPGLTPVKENEGPFLLDPRPLYWDKKQFHTVVSEYFLLHLDEELISA